MRTESQREASRINGAKSKGPTTPEGKAVAKLNGLKHGLRAEQVVLPGEDPAEFEAERQGWFDDWGPASHTRAILCERAAVASWRLRRAVRTEAARLARAADDAAWSLGAERVARVDRATDRFADDPGAAVALLRLSAEGLDRLIDRWAGLGRALEGGAAAWSDADLHHGRLMKLLGRHPEDDPATVGPAAEASARLLAANAPGGKRPSPAEAESDLARLRETIASELADLRARRADATDPDLDRRRAVDAALADDSKESQLHHRYEMAHERSLRDTINQLRALARSGADLPEPDDSAPNIVPELIDNKDIAPKFPAEAATARAVPSGSLGAASPTRAEPPAPVPPGRPSRGRGARPRPSPARRKPG